MAVKKSDLYQSLWNSCDELRGGMDASLYKDYVLTILFIKYVTDRFKGDPFAEIVIPEGGSFDDLIKAKGNIHVGEIINTTIGKLAEANSLSGVIDVADFDSDDKLGSGKDKIEKLTNLIGIFEDDKLDFRKNKAGGDDIIGDAYEYLMKHFASESGKSKGQFYTPAEVSRIMAKVIGISNAKQASETIYDPACGSGSLLIRAADEAPVDISIYGQEYDPSTAGLAKMNLVLHNKSTGEIKQGNTLSDYKHKDSENNPRRFDYVVANPPFSYKSWSNGVDPASDPRFTGFGAIPPNKNGDYAWLMHFVYSLKPEKGKGAIILPHGVLFRGNAEDTIRKEIVKRKIIKGIIGLPANLFFGTGIPACIIVVDKEEAASRNGIFMIDASKGFIKDGNKNKLREQDIKKIIDCFTYQFEMPKYSRLIPYSEIENNEYNLNIPRYIDSSDSEDLQDIEAHLLGGIPKRDIDDLSSYWNVFPGLRDELFVDGDRDNYLNLRINKNDIRKTIYENKDFKNYAEKIKDSFNIWKDKQKEKLYGLSNLDNPKDFITDISEDMINIFSDITLIDKYDVYQCLMTYWEEVMQDDVYSITYDGWESGKDIEFDFVKKKDGSITEKFKGYEGKIIPQSIVINRFFKTEQSEIDQLSEFLDELYIKMEEMRDENSGEDGLLSGAINDKGAITKGDLQKRLREIKGDNDFVDEFKTLKEYEQLIAKESMFKSEIKAKSEALDKVVIEKYRVLGTDEVKEIVIEDKWCKSILNSIDSVYSDISHRLTNRVVELVERYEETLPSIESAVCDYEYRVKSHLERMGFVWN